MPWSGSSGSETFSRTDGTRNGSTVWTQAKAASVKVNAADHDTHDEDIADGLNLALKKDGGNTATANIPMGGFIFTGLGAGTNNGESVRWEQIKTLVGTQAASELTISSGSVTPTRGVHTIDTESDAASDDLANIVTTNLADGSLLIISAANSARTVVVKDMAGGAGQIHTYDGNDVSIDDANEYLTLLRSGADWYEVARSQGLVTAGVAGADVDINGTTAETTIANDDEVLIYDTTAGANRKITRTNFIPDASTSVPGKIEIATSAEVTAASDTTRAVTPGTVGDHPAIPKSIVVLNNLSGTPGVVAFYNTLGSLSASRASAGRYTFTWTTSLSVVRPFITVQSTSATPIVGAVPTGGTSGTSCQVNIANSSGTAVDAELIYIAIYGS